MSSPEADAAQAKSNSKLFYRALVGALLRPEVEYTDAHYLRVTLPPSDEFPGGTAKISNYPSYLLKAAHAIIEEQRVANMTRIEAGRDDIAMPATTESDYRRLLDEGIAFMDVAVSTPDGKTHNDIVGCPGDLMDDDYIVANAVRSGLEPEPEQPFVYNMDNEGRYVPDPFQEPHLLALYRHLTADGGAPSPAQAPPQPAS